MANRRQRTRIEEKRIPIHIREEVVELTVFDIEQAIIEKYNLDGFTLNWNIAGIDESTRAIYHRGNKEKERNIGITATQELGRVEEE